MERILHQINNCYDRHKHQIQEIEIEYGCQQKQRGIHKHSYRLLVQYLQFLSIPPIFFKTSSLALDYHLVLINSICLGAVAHQLLQIQKNQSKENSCRWYNLLLMWLPNLFDLVDQMFDCMSPEGKLSLSNIRHERSNYLYHATSDLSKICFQCVPSTLIFDR